VPATSSSATFLATLGPSGTFSELAAREVLRLPQFTKAPPTISFYSSLSRTLQAIPEQAGIAVVPLENIVEGIVSPVVDSFLKQPLQIIAEVAIPVRFSVVANHPQPDVIFAQFVAQGQCSDWLSQHDIEVISTASNTAALAQLQATTQAAAAIIPEHLLAAGEPNASAADWAWVEHDVTDYAHNVTRFVAVQQPQPLAAPDHSIRYKSSIVIVDDADHPGLLLEHLQAFAVHQINLLALVSRPTGQRFGHYHFFIEFEGHLQHPRVQAALSAIELRNQVIQLGSYEFSS